MWLNWLIQSRFPWKYKRKFNQIPDMCYPREYDLLTKTPFVSFPHSGLFLSDIQIWLSLSSNDNAITPKCWCHVYFLFHFTKTSLLFLQTLRRIITSSVLCEMRLLIRALNSTAFSYTTVELRERVIEYIHCINVYIFPYMPWTQWCGFWITIDRVVLLISLAIEWIPNILFWKISTYS